MFGTLLAILGSLGMFLFGMRVMSEALQKLSGEKLRGMIQVMTGDRVRAMGSGFLVTCLVQSSSASTVMIVGFVNAGLLTLVESVGMILGANLGTTTTFWIISFLGFKFSVSSVALPIIGIGFPLLFIKNAKVRDAGECLVGFGILFLGLLLLKDSVPSIDENPEIFEFVTGFTDRGIVSVLFFFAFGAVLTVAVQSSSVAGAITLTMAFKGWIDYPSAAAIILGENVGTTITANLAALAGNVNAKRAAFAHFVFNIFGVIWAIALFGPLTALVDAIVPGDSSDPMRLPFHMAAFHTLFNTINILLVIGFVPRLADLATRVIRGRQPVDGGPISYQMATMPQTSEINLAEAERDVRVLAGHARALVAGFGEVFENPGPEMKKRVAELRRIEKQSDALALRVTNYLIECSAGRLSEGSMLRVSALLRVIAELEDMCDCGNRLVQLAGRRSKKNRELPPDMVEKMKEFTGVVIQFIDFWSGCLPRRVTAADMETALQLESLIESSRKRLRKESMRRMQMEGDAIKAEMLAIDMLGQMERIGKHSVNILQALRHDH